MFMMDSSFSIAARCWELTFSGNKSTFSNDVFLRIKNLRQVFTVNTVENIILDVFSRISFVVKSNGFLYFLAETIVTIATF